MLPAAKSRTSSATLGLFGAGLRHLLGGLGRRFGPHRRGRDPEWHVLVRGDVGQSEGVQVEEHGVSACVANQYDVGQILALAQNADFSSHTDRYEFRLE